MQSKATEGGRDYPGPGAPPSKICTGCMEFRPVSEFYRNKQSRDGRDWRCKACVAARRARYIERDRRLRCELTQERNKRNVEYFEHHGEPRIVRTEKICPRCGVTKPTSEFYVDRRSDDGRHTPCKECQRKRPQDPEKGRRWRANNPERARALAKRYRATEGGKQSANIRNARRRRAKAGGVLTGRQWRAVLEFYNHTCLRCGSAESISMDHVVPLSLGGSHEVCNVQPLCMPCNRMKGTKTTDYRGPQLHAQLMESLGF